MTFEYAGRKFDTDKRIYVLGYKITTSWFPFDSKESSSRGRIDDYGATVAGALVKELVFDIREIDWKKKNVVIGLRLDFSKACGYSGSRVFDERCIIGHSSKECLKIYEEEKSKWNENQ